MKHLIILSLLTFAFASCGDKYEFWDISEFKMDNKALEDDEEVKILYSSSAPDYDTDRDYYVQMVVVSQKTGDTVNVLTTLNYYLTKDDKDKVFNFMNQDNIVTKLGQMDLNNLKDVKHVDDITSQPSKNITKVARDPEFDFIAHNNYPTIIGSIGVVTENEK